MSTTNHDWLKDLIRSSSNLTDATDVDAVLKILLGDVLLRGVSDLSRAEIVSGIGMATDILAASRSQRDIALLTTPQQVFAFNKLAVLDVLGRSGAHEAEVRYSGGGDEGQLDDCSVEPAIENITAAPVSLIYRQSRWDAQQGRNVTVNELVETDLHTALCDMCWAALDVTGNSNFADGGGGCGTMNFDVLTRSVKLEHIDYFTDSRAEGFTL